MKHGKDVRPEKWTNVYDLYDDGEVSFIVGCYDNSQVYSIGIRYNGRQNLKNNGNIDIGYPCQGSNPTWFLLPDWLSNQILSILKTFVISNQNWGNLSNIDKAFSLVN